MSLKFPQYEDIPLQSSPLAEVICQVRIPPILMIAKEQPAEFQDEIRKRFPDYEMDQGIALQIGNASNLASVGAEITARLHRFLSEDRETTVSLTSDFYAVATRNYTNWSDFADDIRLVDSSVRRIYRPVHATRIGLRYVNNISEDNSGCSSPEELTALLRPELVSLFSTEAWASPQEMLSQVRLDDEPGTLLLRVGYSQLESKPSLLLDLDYYEEGTIPLEGLVARCMRYHDVIYRAFRWSVREHALNAFDPIARR